jgi:hypothetical protein
MINSGILCICCLLCDFWFDDWPHFIVFPAFDWIWSDGKGFCWEFVNGISDKNCSEYPLPPFLSLSLSLSFSLSLLSDQFIIFFLLTLTLNIGQKDRLCFTKANAITLYTTISLPFIPFQMPFFLASE